MKRLCFSPSVEGRRLGIASGSRVQSPGSVSLKEGKLTTRTIRTVYRGVSLTVCIKQIPSPIYSSRPGIPYRWGLHSATTAHQDDISEMMTDAQRDELVKQVLEEIKE
jgi:hypothetical protein